LLLKNCFHYHHRHRRAHTRHKLAAIATRRSGRGFLYLVAIMDWAAHKLLVWRLSNSEDVTMTTVKIAPL